MAKEKELTLDEFKVQVEKDLEKFYSDYKKNHERNPEHYPKTLWMGDWYEQFMIYD